VSKPPPKVRDLQVRRDRCLFEIKTLEGDIVRIQDQLVEAQGTRRERTDWFRRAADAKRHKERERRILLAKLQRLNRKLGNVKPEARRAEAKEQLREVLRALFRVARASLDFYEDENELTEETLTDALDWLDQVVPNWDQPQEPKERKPALRMMGLDE